MNRNGYATVSYNTTTEYHTNGNHGILATNTTNNKRPYIRLWISDISTLIGNTISYTADVKTVYALKLCIYEHDGSNYTGHNVIIPANSEDTFTVTCAVASTTTALWTGIEFQSAQNQGDYFYSDNWILEIIQ